MSRPGDTGKGWFGAAKLAVARRYIYPSGRGRMIGVGLLGLILALTLFGLDFLMGEAHWVSNGPLTSSHATLEQDCAACHDPTTRTVTVERCAVCHEKAGDELGTYTYPAHYVYRSGDFRRVSALPHEVPCYSCHAEHRGREASLTRVAPTPCLSCHPAGPLGSGHPEFEPVAEDGLVDPAGLEFSHGRHVREIMTRRGLLDSEQACLSCHVPDRDGRGFEALDFDQQCDACHLQAGVATPRLPLATADEAGVLPLETIRALGEPGTEWSLFTNPNELRQAGPTILKTTLYHRDPWVLYNLRRIRKTLYTDGGLADLLEASPTTSASDLPGLYEEMVDRLEQYVVGLRGRPEPEIQAELARIEEILERVRRQLRDPWVPLDETEMLLALSEVRPELSPDEVAAWEELADSLTAPCQTCHELDRATIARVQKDQKAYQRAEFDHRAHVLQARCLDCHRRIPLAEMLESPDAPLPDNDLASVYNLPGQETCVQCHTPELASVACVTCHLFHPNRGRRSELLLYVDH